MLTFLPGIPSAYLTPFPSFCGFRGFCGTVEQASIGWVYAPLLLAKCFLHSGLAPESRASRIPLMYVAQL